MDTIAVVLHVFICLFLIGIILLQAGKGADIGAVFGGSSQTVFGGRGPATFLNKMTIVVSVIFLLTSVWLSKIGQEKGTESVIGKIPVEMQVSPPPTSSPTSGEEKKEGAQ